MLRNMPIDLIFELCCWLSVAADSGAIEAVAADVEAADAYKRNGPDCMAAAAMLEAAVGDITETGCC